MKKYETYKDSGLEWLGCVPKHWEVVPIKYVLDQSNEGIKIGPFGSSLTGKVSPDYPVRVYGQWNVVGQDFNAGKNFVTEETYEELSSYQISPNDILISMMGTVGKCAIIPETAERGIMDSHIVKVRLDNNKILPEFFYYIYDKDCSKVVIEQIQRNKRGSIMDGLNSSLIKNFIITLPPLTEQRTIAAYLDHKVGQIDALISEKEKMVDDLKAFRSSVITEAVTKGLDKNVEMKDSGLEWLGNVPGNWEVLPLKHLVSEPLQYGANESADDCIISDPRYIRITDITENGDLRDSTYKTLPRSKAIGYMLKKGDVLFARSGATVGKTYVFKEDYDACFAGYLIKASCNKKLIPMFLYYFTSSNSYENWKNSIFNQATIQNIGADKYSILPIPLPSRSEQQKIVNYLNDKIDKIGNAISEQEHQLSDLKSYKASLITEAVTGKIDLRDWQTQKA
jgi:type I restriction enzyme, S subunit